jgi:glycosyltransferase involved in cell wall biosynthesis
MNKKEAFVSVIIVTDNDLGGSLSRIQELSVFMAENYNDYEIVVVDQSSVDGTVESIENLMGFHKGLRLIKLAFPVANDVAVSAGIENCIGDFVITFSLDRDPIPGINDLIQLCQQGSDIIIGVSKQRVGHGYFMFGPLARVILTAIGYDLPRGSTDLRCLSRRTVNAITRTGGYHHQLFVRISKTGYQTDIYKYVPLSNKNFSLFSELSNFGRLLVFNSTKPLRWLSGLGIVFSVPLFLFCLIDSILNWIKGGDFVYQTVILGIFSGFFALIFVLTLFLGEYLGRILDNLGDHPKYFVIEEKNSSVMLTTDQLNVTNESN